ncbi:MAG: hypothetical protein RL117_1501 [Verrucomicrobiota bacterium]
MVFDPVLAFDRAIEEISGIELHRGLVGEHFHFSTTGGMHDAGRAFHACRWAQDPAVIVSARERERFEGGIDAVANDHGLGEVERRADNTLRFSGRNQARIGRQEMVGVDQHHVIEDGLREITREIPIGVMDHVDDRWRIGGRARFPDQFVVVIERVSDRDIERAGVAFFSCRRLIAENHRIFLDFAAPEDLVEAFQATVKMARNAAGFVVFGERVSLAIELEFSVLDAIAKTSDRGAEIGVIGQPAGEGIVAQCDICDVSLAIGRFERQQ